jgi:DNA-binding PadR family transcriptional regulator
MTKRKVSNPLALAVLACVAERPMHPYEMATTMRERGKDESIKLNYGSLYGVVESLQRHGMLEPQETVRDGRRPERTVYRITDAGHHEFTDWLGELLSTPAKEFRQFEAGLSLIAGLAPEDTVAALTQRVRLVGVELARLRAVREMTDAEALPRLFMVEEEYRVALLEAELEFTRKLIADIESGALDGLDLWRSFHEPPD